MQSFISVKPNLWIPTDKARTPFLVGLGILAIGSVSACALAVPAPARDIIVAFTGAQACGVLPLASFAMLIGSWRSNAAHPKVALALGSTILFGLAIVLLLISGALDPEMVSDDTTSWEGSAAIVSCMYMPIFCLLVYFTIRSYGRAKIALQTNAAASLPLLLAQRDGEAEYADLSYELGIAVDELDALLIELSANNDEVDIKREPKFQRVYTSKKYGVRQRQLRQIVAARGTVYLDELQQELNVPRELLQQWIYQAVDSLRFAGYINWKEEKVYSADAVHLREHSICPTCNNKLTLGGKNVIHCEACGTEIFLDGNK
ncbi:MAG: PCI domain-containing protein [Candidatus Promineifilaceae bacterium]